jgi:hypothetical protein
VAFTQTRNGEHHIPERSRIPVCCGPAEHFEYSGRQAKLRDAIPLAPAKVQTCYLAKFLYPDVTEHPPSRFVHGTHERVGDYVMLNGLSGQQILPTVIRQRTSIEIAESSMWSGAQNDSHVLHTLSKSDTFTGHPAFGRRTIDP